MDNILYRVHLLMHTMNHRKQLRNATKGKATMWQMEPTHDNNVTARLRGARQDTTTAFGNMRPRLTPYRSVAVTHNLAALHYLCFPN